MMTLTYSKQVNDVNDPVVGKINRSLHRLFQTFLPVRIEFVFACAALSIDNSRIGCLPCRHLPYSQKRPCLVPWSWLETPRPACFQRRLQDVLRTLRGSPRKEGNFSHFLLLSSFIDAKCIACRQSSIEPCFVSRMIESNAQERHQLSY
jgi:hypothetical protein